MGRRRGSRGGGRSSRSSKSRSRSSGRSTRGGTASKSSGGSKSSKGGSGRGRSQSSRGSGGSRSKGSTSKAKATSWSTSQTGALGAAIAASKKANPGAWSKALSGGSTATSTKAHWSTSQTGQLGAAIAASQKANPLAWGKAIAGGGTSAMSTSLSDFTSAVNKANEASYQGRKHVVNMANVGTGGTWNIGAAASSFFSSTPFSLMPSASADSATKKTDISGGAISAEQSLTGESVAGWGITVGDSYLVNGGADMQNKAAEGLNNILSMTEKKTDIASLQAQAKAAGWGVNTGAPTGYGMMSAASIDPSGDWYGQYAQRFPSLFVPKQKHVGIAVPKSYQKQFDKYEKIVAFADKHGQDNATVDRAKRLLSLYRGIITNWKPEHGLTDMAIQSGYELKSTHAGDAQLFHAQTGERVIITKAEQALISKFHSDPASLTATQTDQAAMLQAKKENTVVQFTTETVQVPVSTKVQMGEDGKPLPYAQQVGPDGKPEVKYETVIQTKYDQDKDTISTLSTPWGSPTGYSLTPFTSDANREAWKAEGGSNLISAFDSWLKYTYTDNPDPRLRKIPYWFDTRDRIEMTDINDDGVPDQLSIVPYEFDTKERILPEQPEMPVTDIPQFLPAEQYEVPYYVDISAAEKRLEGGESFESIMEKPPLMSEYMYWTDPQDSKEYIMTHDDHKEYLQAVATQKKVIKQQKYDEVFMDVTRGKGPVIPRAMGKRSGASAGPAIQRVMSGTAPREADIGGLVK